MRNLKTVLVCARVNFRKWLTTPRFYVIFAVIIIFEYYTFAGMSKVAAHFDLNSAPWVFPFFLGNPIMFVIMGSLTTLFYCNAPFADAHTPFLIVRTGRRNWIIGQMIYIYLSSFIYTSCFFLLSILMLLPRIEFTTEWGTLLHTISKSPIEVMEQAGTIISFVPHEELLELLTPIQATALAFLLFWLVTAFVGVLICSFNIVIGRMSGIVAAGVFTSIAYFSSFLGTFSIGLWLYYLSPISWSSISYLDWYKTGAIPTPKYAIICLFVAIVILSVISVIGFCKKDLVIQKGDF